MNRVALYAVTGSLALLTLTGCDKTKQQLGMTHSAPDEFAVVRRAPLEMPPDYTIRPPRPGAPRPQEAQVSEQAREVVFGGPQAVEKQAVSPTSAETMLLQQTGGERANPNIRNVVDAETAKLAPAQQPVIKKVMSIGKKQEAAANVVDAKAEAARLQKNRQEGKPVTAGKTPSKEQ